jgi:hypothetical protein
LLNCQQSITIQAGNHPAIYSSLQAQICQQINHNYQINGSIRQALPITQQLSGWEITLPFNFPTRVAPQHSNTSTHQKKPA